MEAAACRNVLRGLILTCTGVQFKSVAAKSFQNADCEGRTVVWTQLPDASWRATGLYDRQYTIVAEGSGWRATADNRTQKCGTLEDAKTWRRCEERRMAAG